MPDLLQGVHIAYQGGDDKELPFLLALPDIDGVGVTSKLQWQEWAQRFELHTLSLDPDFGGSFAELTSSVASWLDARLAGAPPTRPVYVLGEGFGGVLALALGWQCRAVVNRLILVNPATSFSSSPLGRAFAALERLPLPPQVLQGLDSLPPLPLPLPLPLPPPPSPLALALAPMLAQNPGALLRGLAGSLASGQPAEAAKALTEAVAQLDSLGAVLPPAALRRRLRLLAEGSKAVAPLVRSVPQRTLVLAGGSDAALGSAQVAGKLEERMPRAFKKVLPDAGHALLSEPGGALLPLLDAEGFYVTRRVFSSPLPPGADPASVNVFGSAGPVEVPNEQEVHRYSKAWNNRMREINSPVFTSTLPDGTRVLGLAGLPSRLHPHPATAGGGSSHSGPAADGAGNSGSGSGSGGEEGGPQAASAGAGAEAAGSGAGAQGSTGAGEGESQGAGGLPPDWGDGPLLFVGNHQLFAFDMTVMVEQVLLEKGILMRGLAHPWLFKESVPRGSTLMGAGGPGSPSSSTASASSNGHAAVGSRTHSSSSGSSSSSGGGASTKAAAGGGGDSGVSKLIETSTSIMSALGGIRVDGGRKDEEEGGGGSDDSTAFLGNMYQSFGAVKVTPTAMFRLLSNGEAVLLYPGGVREGFKRRNEKYELFWPERSEFVRMAARFGATIVPVSAIGLEDSLALVLDSDEMQRSPLFSAADRERAAATPTARVGVAAGAGIDETFVPPLIAPSWPPSRFYFHFGKPVRTSPDMAKDREACDKVYGEVKSAVQDGITYLLRKREQDPYADFLTRMVYEANPPFGPKRVAPTFEP
ncbi:hypothetical protein HYH03_003321 [Edaphochlamys debaryana]|uniref:Uncharacterized protein n=1 Tax=Edaphochlamys debaryana TaxID=47281 RepID=A0A835Y941_9CHLO|nr:hypothetical protein HYH03_003321 [Edaphochlamys debaryana]|eukprot:KAG2498570.1 hypothetical protein HYH03_003321 [Edaphochlamys debaryana]